VKSVFPVPLDLQEANQFVACFHRHSKRRLPGLKFAIGASDGTSLVGVAIVGRPPRLLQDGYTMDVKRNCVVEGAPKGTPSFLYAACWRAWRAMGGRRMITYTLQTENGASLRGAGARVVAELEPNDPAAWQNRPGREWLPQVGQAKFRWEWAA
jgi:hypothetical protein